MRPLAKGGMAEILEARDRDGRVVVVKRLKEGLSKDPEIVARFQREAAAIQSLSHKNVVQVFDVGVDAGRPFMVMEKLEGRDLGDELKERAAMPLDEAASLLAQACQGMAAAHEAGLVHRDLKPSNLFLAQVDGKRVLKVLDFGITKLTKGPGDGQITLTQAVFGSPLYMSPEAFRSAKLADVRSDVWSLGVIFYEMLTGVTPFLADTALSVGFMVSREDFAPPSAKDPRLPRSVDVVVGRALKKDPAQRYQSMRELLAALEVFMPQGRNHTMTVAQVTAPPGADDEPRTMQMKEGVTILGMMKPGASQPSLTNEADAFDAPTRVVVDPTEATTRVQVIDDDPSEAPTRMRTDAAAAIGAALANTGRTSSPSEVGETGRVAGPVSLDAGSTVATPKKKSGLPAIVFAVPAAALLFGLGGWYLGRGPDVPSPAAKAAAAAPTVTSTPVVTAAPTAAAPSATALATADATATAAESAAPPEASAEPSASASEAQVTAAPKPTGRARPKPPPKKGKFVPTTI
jgi:serine/threonine-protein kinase